MELLRKLILDQQQRWINDSKYPDNQYRSGSIDSCRWVVQVLDGINDGTITKRDDVVGWDSEVDGYNEDD